MTNYLPSIININSCARHGSRDMEMKKVYFNDNISDVNFQITESYIQYGSKVIPTNAISYFAADRVSVSWWLTILLFFVGSALTTYGFLSNHNGIDNVSVSMVYLGYSGIIALLAAVVVAIITFIESRRRIIIVSSHSKQSILIELNGTQFKHSYEPIMKALFEVVEDNNSINIHDNQGTT